MGLTGGVRGINRDGCDDYLIDNIYNSLVVSFLLGHSLLSLTHF